MSDKPYEPKTDLAKLLLVVVQEIHAMQGGAQPFANTNISAALKQADAIAKEAHNG